MAMKLGGKYRFRDVTARHWEKLGEALGFRPDFVRRQVLTMNGKIVEAAAVLSGELNKNPETKSLIYERITGITYINKNFQSKRRKTIMEWIMIRFTTRKRVYTCTI